MQRTRGTLNRILKFLQCEDKEISLLFVDDDEIRQMNRDYLERDYPTNVMAFSLSEGLFGDINPQMLGDIVISVETAMRDARQGGITLDDELAFLMIHGLLHLLNFNHEDSSPEEAIIMKNKEQKIFLALKGYVID